MAKDQEEYFAPWEPTPELRYRKTLLQAGWVRSTTTMPGGGEVVHPVWERRLQQRWRAVVYRNENQVGAKYEWRDVEEVEMTKEQLNEQR